MQLCCNTKNMSNNYLNGVGVALVTPFNEDLSVDYTALENIIKHVINGGVSYVVTLGTTGETPTLTKEEKKQVAHFTLEKVNGAVPVVIGIGGNATNEVINNISYLEADKFEAILSVSPYYNKPSQQGILEHYKAIASATTKNIILYNVPGRTGRNVIADTTISLANQFSNIIAVKEASGDMAQNMELVSKAPQNFSIVSGDDDLVLPQIACGLKGVISVVANAYPKQFSEMVALCHQNKYADARAIHYQLLPLINLLFAENNPAGIKAALSTMGLCKNIFRLPAMPVSDDLMKKIETFVSSN
jgi:4-hydroxy-tetrahydrodipicolinate synthase